MTRELLVVVHPRRAVAARIAAALTASLTQGGLSVRALEDEEWVGSATVPVTVVAGDERAAEGCELVVVLGGDGTILRGAEVAAPAGVPLLGINLGHVGFLAEGEAEDLPGIVDQIIERRYDVEERSTLDVVVRDSSELLAETWALNDASVEKAARERMLEVMVEIDGRPLSRWGCDGVICATPTGSTAYAFSAGGPVVWPDVDALLVVPISAHALFARPLVVGPSSVVAVDVLAPPGGGGRDGAVLWCDGRRTVELPGGARVEVRRGERYVRLARLSAGPFTDRLVAKFDLRVEGWRGGRSRQWPMPGGDGL